MLARKSDSLCEPARAWRGAALAGEFNRGSEAAKDNFSTRRLSEPLLSSAAETRDAECDGDFTVNDMELRDLESAVVDDH